MVYPPGSEIAERFVVRNVRALGPLGVQYDVEDRVESGEGTLLVVAEELCATASDCSQVGTRIEMFVGRSIAGCAMPRAVGSDDGSLWVLSRTIEGVTLRSVMAARAATRSRFTLEETLRVMGSLALATAALHSATPHGALSPENVMVTPRGIVLLNSTVALAVPLEKLQTRLQRFARTIPFVSPEAARGRRVTATADLYALGAIASELLTGSPLARSIDASTIDAHTDASLRMLLDREPTRRPAALGALLDALARASGLSARPIPPAAPTVDEAPAPSQVPSRRRPSSSPPVRADGMPPSAALRAPALPTSLHAEDSVIIPAMDPTPSRPRLPSVAPREPARPASPRVPTLAANRPPEVPVKPAVPARPRDRDLEGIDPRLLRAARKLEAQRSVDSDPVDAGDVELIDD